MSGGTWIMAGALALLAAAFLIAPALRKTHKATQAQREINLRIYRERAAELDDEHAAGLLSAAQHEDARRELERNLLADTGPADDAPAASGTRGRWGLVAVGLLVPVAALFLHLHSVDRPQTTPAMADEHELAPMVAMLAARLRERPDDAEGWLMLARSYTFMQQHRDAAESYAVALELGGENPQLLIEYAEQRILANEGVVDRDTAALIARALTLDPNNASGLWLSGIGAYQRGDYPRAAADWRALLVQLPPDGADARAVAAAIDDLPGEGWGETSAAIASDTVEVEVSLAEPLTEGLLGNELVLVYARETGGSRALLAAVRTTAEQLPTRVRLTGVTPSQSRAADIEVIARLSRSGDAAPRSGDLQGASGPLALPAREPIRVRIEAVVP